MLGLAGFAILLLVVLSIVSLVASIWLVVVAFRKSLGWGFAVLLVPLAAIVFAVLNWREAKKPFLVSLAATVAAVAVALSTVGVGAAAVSRQMADRMSREMAREIEKGAAEGRTGNASMEGIRESGTTTEGGTATESASEYTHVRGVASEPAKLSVREPARVRPGPISASRSRNEELSFDGADITSDGYAEVALRDAKRAVGRQVRVIAKDGAVHEGDLLRATTAGIEIEHVFRAGTISVEYPRSEIGRLLVKVLP